MNSNYKLKKTLLIPRHHFMINECVEAAFPDNSNWETVENGVYKSVYKKGGLRALSQMIYVTKDFEEVLRVELYEKVD